MNMHFVSNVDGTSIRKC
ncbi:hypothetical protein ACNKHU_26085 [Shigella flexneri]